jgi:hypothetical protein
MRWRIVETAGGVRAWSQRPGEDLGEPHPRVSGELAAWPEASSSRRARHEQTAYGGSDEEGSDRPGEPSATSVAASTYL